ncbi:MAG TPA: aquaporin [Candidatus Saccharimonadales bacterium]|nr:aquaporin [Candidatus Saccharimonadales bacterium]
MFRKNKLAMLVGEFLGTASLTLIVLAISHSQLSLSYFIASAAGLMVALMTLALAGISGAVFNPAMTIGLWTVRKLRTMQALSYLVVQLLGGAVAWELFVYLTKITGIHNTGTYSARILVAEVVGTFVFAFVWAAAIYQRFNLYAKAAAIGGGLMAGSLVASLGSAGILNPAVALGLHQWGWGTYVLGPVLGAVIGFNLYNLLFVETELAEVAESRAEKAKTSMLNATLTQSEVATEVRASATSTTPRAKAGTASRKPAAKKSAAKKKSAGRSSSARRRNPNAA